MSYSTANISHSTINAVSVYSFSTSRDSLDNASDNWFMLDKLLGETIGVCQRWINRNTDKEILNSVHINTTDECFLDIVHSEYALRMHLEYNIPTKPSKKLRTDWPVTRTRFWYEGALDLTPAAIGMVLRGPWRSFPKVPFFGRAFFTVM